MSYVDTAGSYARRLCQIEARRARIGFQDAIEDVARKLKRPMGSIRKLIYAPPKSICAEFYAQLQTAVETELLNEMKAIEHELAMVRAGGVRRSPGEISEIEQGLARLRDLLDERKH